MPNGFTSSKTNFTHITPSHSSTALFRFYFSRQGKNDEILRLYVEHNLSTYGKKYRLILSCNFERHSEKYRLVFGEILVV